MSEILFRGKRTFNGEWVKGYYVCLNGDDHRIYDGLAEADCEGLHPNWWSVNPATVGQYTGLTDQNGVRIFEGDIVLAVYRYKEKYQVAMDNDRRGWWPFACGDGCGCCETDTVSPDDCEVLGNIHDNPEPLEGCEC